MDKVLDELTKMRAQLSAIQAQQDEEDDEEAARRDEEEARREEEEGARHRENARRARDDEDEEEARREEEEAAACFAKAMQAHRMAAAHHTSLAARRRDEEDEEGAKREEDDAKRREEDAQAAKREEEEARRREEDAGRREEEAARRGAKADESDDEDEEDQAWGRVMALFMRDARRKEEDAAHDPVQRKATLFHQNEEMAKAFMAGMKAAMSGMTFPSGTQGRRRSEANHDDAPQDKALIQQMLRQKGLKASAPGLDRQTRRQLRQLQASMELLTDIVKQFKGLLTDTTQPRGMVTDRRSNAPNGGQAPQRRSMSGASAELWVDKYASQRNGRPGNMKTPAEVTEDLKAQGITDPTRQIAAIVEMQQRGECTLH